MSNRKKLNKPFIFSMLNIWTTISYMVILMYAYYGLGFLMLLLLFSLNFFWGLLILFISLLSLYNVTTFEKYRYQVDEVPIKLPHNDKIIMWKQYNCKYTGFRKSKFIETLNE